MSQTQAAASRLCPWTANRQNLHWSFDQGCAKPLLLALTHNGTPANAPDVSQPATQLTYLNLHTWSPKLVLIIVFFCQFLIIVILCYIDKRTDGPFYVKINDLVQQLCKLIVFFDIFLTLALVSFHKGIEKFLPKYFNKDLSYKYYRSLYKLE